MNDINELKAAEKNSEAKKNHAHGPVNSWAAGIFMILLGGVFLATTNDWFELTSSRWMLWLLIPAYWVLIAAWSAYSSDNPEARAKSLMILLFGLMPFAFAAIPALGLGSQFIAPLVLIIIGLSMIFRHTFA